MKFAAGLILLLTTQAYAVEVRSCPKDFTITFSKINVVSSGNFRLERGGNFQEAESMRLKLMETQKISEEFFLVGTKTGRCEYEGNESVAILATSKGKDWLRLERKLGYASGHFEIYVSIAQYSPSELRPTGLATFGYSSNPGLFSAFLGSSPVQIR